MSGNLEPSGPVQACNGLVLPFFTFLPVQGSRISRKNWITYALKKEPAYFAETSVTEYQYLKRNIPEE